MLIMSSRLSVDFTAIRLEIEAERWAGREEAPFVLPKCVCARLASAAHQMPTQHPSGQVCSFYFIDEETDAPNGMAT